MAFDLFNPMLGMDMSEEQKKMMLARALMSGGAAMLGGSKQPGAVPFGQGVSAMMGSLDQQQQMALAAQMQALQRKNIEHGMDIDERRFTQQGAQFDQQMGMQERRLGIEDKRLGIAERTAGMQASEYSRKNQMEQERQKSAEKIQELMGSGADEATLARAIMAHNMLYGGTPSSNVSNVLMPSGMPKTSGNMFADLLGGGGAGGMGMPPGAAPAPSAPAPMAPTQTPSLQEGLGRTQELDAAAQATRQLQQKQQEATRFVDTKLVPASSGPLGFGFGSTTDPKEIQTLIDQAEEYWPLMGERDRQLTLTHIRRLKEKLK